MFTYGRYGQILYILSGLLFSWSSPAQPREEHIFSEHGGPLNFSTLQFPSELGLVSEFFLTPPRNPGVFFYDHPTSERMGILTVDCRGGLLPPNSLWGEQLAIKENCPQQDCFTRAFRQWDFMALAHLYITHQKNPEIFIDQALEQLLGSFQNSLCRWDVDMTDCLDVFGNTLGSVHTLLTAYLTLKDNASAIDQGDFKKKRRLYCRFLKEAHTLLLAKLNHRKDDSTAQQWMVGFFKALQENLVLQSVGAGEIIEVKSRIFALDEEGFEKERGVRFSYLRALNYGKGHYIIFRSEELPRRREVAWQDRTLPLGKGLDWQESLGEVKLNREGRCPRFDLEPKDLSTCTAPLWYGEK